MNKGEEYLEDLPSDSAVDLQAEVAFLREQFESLKADLASAAFDTITESDANSILASLPAGLGKVSPDVEGYARRGVARARLETMRILAAKLAGDYAAIAPRDPLFAGMASTFLADPHGPSGLSFRKGVYEYLKQKKSGWASKTYQAVAYSLSLAADLVGDQRPSCIAELAIKKPFGICSREFLPTSPS